MNNSNRERKKLYRAGVEICRKISDFGFELLQYPPYSPDLTLFDYHALLQLKQSRKCRFSSKKTQAVEVCFAEQDNFLNVKEKTR